MQTFCLSLLARSDNARLKVGPVRRGELGLQRLARGSPDLRGAARTRVSLDVRAFHKGMVPVAGPGGQFESHPSGESQIAEIKSNAICISSMIGKSNSPSRTPCEIKRVSQKHLRIAHFVNKSVIHTCFTLSIHTVLRSHFRFILVSYFFHTMGIWSVPTKFTTERRPKPM